MPEDVVDDVNNYGNVIDGDAAQTRFELPAQGAVGYIIGGLSALLGEHMGVKPYMTVDEQIRLIEERGLVFADKERAASFLLREGYYAVINGYKDAFIDKQATNLAHDDRYKEGLPFT